MMKPSAGRSGIEMLRILERFQKTGFSDFPVVEKRALVRRDPVHGDYEPSPCPKFPVAE
ncbi:MAG: hypothetical protein GYA23_13765 [Methanomicrobiales archaeon]|nr:hypothetical protein [Methanomicrobiales archaeon]